MKKDFHPQDYRAVVFQDLNNDFSFLTRSTVASDEVVKWKDGNEYPLVKVHISSASHPFFTGEERVLDIEGRVDKFKARAGPPKPPKKLAPKPLKNKPKAQSRPGRKSRNWRSQSADDIRPKLEGLERMVT